MPYQVHFISLGCAKNVVNCEQMMALCREAGHTLQPEPEGSDVVVVNTCGFLSSANEEAIGHILQMGQLKAQGQIGKILVTGCMTQRYGEDVPTELPEVDGILGTGSYKDIVPALDMVMAGGHPRYFDDINAPVDEFGRVLTTPGHYAYLRIAEGCDNWCAFCIIPKLRGKYRSRPMDRVLEEARALAGQGVRELIVVAQDITRYGTDWDGHHHLADLLEELCKLDFHWIRLHYLYPDQMDERLIDVIAREEKILKYLDIPLQHCNDDILRRMNRRGDRAAIEALLDKLQAHFDRVREIACDVKVLAPAVEAAELKRLLPVFVGSADAPGRRVPLLPRGGDPGGQDGPGGPGGGRPAGGAGGGHPVPDHGRVERGDAGGDPGGPLRRVRRPVHVLCGPQLRREPGH